MTKLDWKKSKEINGAMSVADEAELTRRDAASLFLERHDRVTSARRQIERQRRRSEPGSGCGVSGWDQHIKIFTDGACEPNPGPGGWGVVVFDRDKIVDRAFGGAKATTNNVMELMGVIMGLRWAEANRPAAPVVIFSDSQYVVRGCNEWRMKWKARGWRRKEGAKLLPVKNVEEWKELDALLSRVQCKIEWVKGHAKIRGNEIADRLSLEGRASIL